MSLEAVKIIAAHYEVVSSYMQSFYPTPELISLWDDGSHDHQSGGTLESSSYRRYWKSQKVDARYSCILSGVCRPFPPVRPQELRFENGRLCAVEFTNLSSEDWIRPSGGCVGGKAALGGLGGKGELSLYYSSRSDEVIIVSFSEDDKSHRLSGPASLTRVSGGIRVDFAVFGEVVETIYYMKSERDAERLLQSFGRYATPPFMEKDFRPPSWASA